MKKPEIEGIIWDFGNVLARFNHLRACIKLAHFSSMPLKEIQKALFSGNQAPAKLHEVGKLSPEEFFLAARTAAHFDERLLFEEFSTIWRDIFDENEGLGAVLDRIRPEVKRCILSNTEPIHWLAIEKLPVIKRYFRDPRLLVRSYLVGTRKPDPKMYHAALKCLRISKRNIGSVLYIDDIAEYREAFERMGGKMLAYDCSKNTLAHLKVGLQEFGVLVS